MGDVRATMFAPSAPHGKSADSADVDGDFTLAFRRESIYP